MSATITYVPNPTEPTPSQVFNDENVLFGLYRVRFDDGWTVAIPHTGWPNTISAEPLDPDEPRAPRHPARPRRANEGGGMTNLRCLLWFHDWTPWTEQGPASGWRFARQCRRCKSPEYKGWRGGLG
jgi:hypothetical protein